MAHNRRAPPCTLELSQLEYGAADFRTPSGDDLIEVSNDPCCCDSFAEIFNFRTNGYCRGLQSLDCVENFRSDTPTTHRRQSQKIDIGKGERSLPTVHRFTPAPWGELHPVLLERGAKKLACSR